MEVWRCLGERAVVFLARLFNTILGINEEEVYCYQFSRTRVMYRTVVGTKGLVDKPYHGTMGKKC